MKQYIPAIAMASLLLSCSQDQTSTPRNYIEVEYPQTLRLDHEDELWGQKVSDPYRWLENDRSDSTEHWVGEQNEVTFGYLEQIPFREQIRKRIEELWAYERVSLPRKEGEQYYFSKNNGLQNQSVVYVKSNLDEEERVFLDPNDFSEDGTTALGGLTFTEDGSLVVISIQEAGSDWRKAVVMDVDSHEIIGDTLKDIKFSSFSWNGNEGFFYSSYDKPDGSELSAMTDQHKLYYHRLGTPQSEDQFIFGGRDIPRRYINASTLGKGEWLFITASVNTATNELYYKHLPTDGPILPLVTGFDQRIVPMHATSDEVFLYTNSNAPNFRLVKAPMRVPTDENWQDILPNKEKSVLRGTSFVGGKIIASYMQDAHSVIEQYELDGTLDREIGLPGIGSANGFQGDSEDTQVLYQFTSYTYPPSIFLYDLETGESTLQNAPEVDFNPQNYTTKQVWFTSKDGTPIPMFVTHKKGITMDGSNPTYLYGYGGFNVSLTPSFSTRYLYWLEQGGILAIPSLRGGGEYGKAWHTAGTQMNKQNVFDDFIAAAEYLIAEKYTSSAKLAISGGSNGGLLVGATMTQRPDLMAVALPAVGVLDMLRYHKFTAGAGWTFDYGNADQSQEMFEYLLGYSPVHNVKPGTSYPATMVTTGDHDDRVVPAHSFKFAAQLQANHEGQNPVLIRIETDAGHGSGKPISKIIKEIADQYTFTLYNMGIEPTPTEQIIQLQ